MHPPQSDPETARELSEADMAEELASPIQVDWNALTTGDTLVMRLKEKLPYVDSASVAKHWHVVNYIPAPRLPQAGDKVRMAGGHIDGHVICVDGDYAWVRWTDPSGSTYRGVHPAECLQRVVKS